MELRHEIETLYLVTELKMGLAGQIEPSVQVDIIMIKFWVSIVENCTENGHGPAVIFSSELHELLLFFFLS